MLGKTALQRGIERSQVDPEQILVAFASFLSPALLSLSDRTGRSVLHSSCIKGFPQTVEILLARGASPIARDKSGWTSLHFAAFYNRLAVVKLLLSSSSLPSQVVADSPRLGHAAVEETLLCIESKDGWTALHAASSQGHDDIVNELLLFGADPNKTALHGQTPLHVACLNNHSSVVKILRENDADYRIPDKSGLSSLASAQKDIRAVLRKTNSKLSSSPLHTSVIGMPHHPIAERESKFAIQARDSWNRRRTQGGDVFEISITLQSENQTSNQNDADVLDPSIASPGPILSLKTTNEMLSGSRSSVDETAPEIRTSPKSTVHRSEDPRSFLKSSQSNSTPSVFAASTPKEAKSNHTQIPKPSSPLGTSATTDDVVGMRAVSDIVRNRAQTSMSPNGPLTRDNSGLSLSVASDAPSFTLKDLESGLYILKWRPVIEGTYRVSITMKGVEIQGSPIFVAIAPARSRMPVDLRRIVASPSATTNSPKSGRTASTLSNSDEDSLTLRTQSTPVDLITANRPDMTPKAVSNVASQSAPVIKKEKGKKSKGVSSSIIVSSPVSSPSSAPISADNTSRKRSSSTASQKSPEMAPTSNRDRSSTVVPHPDLKGSGSTAIPTDPLRTSKNATTSLPVATGAEPVVASPNLSSSRDRSLYRMESTFSPLKPLSMDAPEEPDAGQLAREVRVLEANLLDLHRQLSTYMDRIQELETEQIINARKHEEMHVDDRLKMTKLATALRAERNNRLCRGCHAASKNAVAVPCLHMSHCNACIENLEDCPVCGTHLKGFITAQLVEGELDLFTPR